MKTIAFYSYKGGVGRTLALVNIANRLSEFCKKVCIIDFDLEAPGLEYKYGVSFPKQRLKEGLVDYIYNFAVNKKVDDIKKYVIEFNPYNSESTLFYIPAGNHTSGEYWKKLSRINWWSLFYEKESLGLQFFLNMKEQIKENIRPDYILIDSRTGITETSSLTMSLLADRVVILAANNQENILGSSRIIDSLLKEENNILDLERELHFVLTRVPISDTLTPDEKMRIQLNANNKIDQIKEVARQNKKELASTHMIFSDRRIEENESHGIYKEFNLSKKQIDSQYMELYNDLTKKDITEEEKKAFELEKSFQKEQSDLINLFVKNDIGFWEQSNEMLKKYKKDISKIMRIKTLRIIYLDETDNFKQAIIECDSLLNIDANNTFALLSKAKVLLKQQKTQEAYRITSKIDYNSVPSLEDKLFIISVDWCYLPKNESNIQKTLSKLNDLLERHPEEPKILNNKACYLRSIGKLDEALDNAYKVLSLDTENGVAYTTLAEIKYMQQDINEFYRNLELALKYKYNIKDIIFDESISVYKEVVDDPRFQNLLQKYNQQDAIEIIKMYRFR